MQLATENSDTKTACELDPSPRATTCMEAEHHMTRGPGPTQALCGPHIPMSTHNSQISANEAGPWECSSIVLGWGQSRTGQCGRAPAGQGC